MKLKLTIKIFISLNALVFSLLFHSQEFVYSDPEDEGFSKERLERIAPVIQNYIDEDLTPGVLTVIMRNEKIVYFETQGYMDVKGKTVEIKGDAKDIIYIYGVDD